MTRAKIGVILPLYGEKRASWEKISEYAKLAEALKYDSLWVPDHFINWTPWLRTEFLPKGVWTPEHLVRLTQKDAFALDGWTALSALATVTRTIRLGTYVSSNQFRHPSLLSKIVSTLDFISNGRVELGIGAGWLKKEFELFGLDWAPLRVRLERLREGIQLMKALMTEDKATFSGKYYNVKDAMMEPKPIQKPHPPIWVGGVMKEIMEITAELADGWIPESLSPQEFSAGIRFIREKAKELNRDPDNLSMAWGGGDLYNFVAEDEASLKKMTQPLLDATGKTVESLPWIIGTTDQCTKKIESYVQAGATHIVLGFPDFPSTHSLELFSKNILPNFM